MNTHINFPLKPQSASSPAPVQSKHAYIRSSGFSDEHGVFQEKWLQLKTVNSAEPTKVPSIIHEVLHSSGELLDFATRAFVEPHFGHDFGQVRIHADAKAAKSSKEEKPSDRSSRGLDDSDPILLTGQGFARIRVSPGPAKTVQTKLTLSQPGDMLEREADSVAEQIMQMGETSGRDGVAVTAVPRITDCFQQRAHTQIARQSTEDAMLPALEEETFDVSSLLSLKEMPGTSHTMSIGLAKQIQSLSHGHPLDSGLRTFFEPRFAHNFAHVRIHTDSAAAQTAQALNARAYTLGRDITFAPGEYRPETQEGKTLLAHELTHVIQQSKQTTAVMRACSCPSFGASTPTLTADSNLRAAFPNLRSSDYCITAPATRTYNCFAWSIGVTDRWVDTEVDSVYGNKNGKLEISDFDNLYATRGLRPVSGSTPADALVALYAKGGTPTHAARRASNPCGQFESKLGGNVRIAHDVTQLEGGAVYGDVVRFYVPQEAYSTTTG